jgi:hypothetical protein
MACPHECMYIDDAISRLCTYRIQIRSLLVVPEVTLLLIVSADTRHLKENIYVANHMKSLAQNLHLKPILIKYVTATACRDEFARETLPRGKACQLRERNCELQLTTMNIAHKATGSNLLMSTRRVRTELQVLITNNCVVLQRIRVPCRAVTVFLLDGAPTQTHVPTRDVVKYCETLA